MLDLQSLDLSLYLRLCAGTFTGALLCLDKIVLQIKLSRPLVTATIIGIIMGTPMTGLTAGALIEIFWANKSPLGTYIPPDDTIVAILITITLALLVGLYPSGSREFMVLTVLAYLPFGHLCQKLEAVPAWFNNRISETALRDTESSGNSMASPVRMIHSLLGYFLFSLVLIVLGLILGLALIPALFQMMPSHAMISLKYTYFFFPLIGIAVLLSTTQNKKALISFFVIFVVCILMRELLNWI